PHGFTRDLVGGNQEIALVAYPVIHEDGLVPAEADIDRLAEDDLWPDPAALQRDARGFTLRFDYGFLQIRVTDMRMKPMVAVQAVSLGEQPLILPGQHPVRGVLLADCAH